MDKASLERAECSVFCAQCHEFLELGKWHPVAPTALGAAALVYSTNFVFSKDAFPELVSCFERFIEKHASHSLFLFFSGGDCPWYPEEPNWYAWKRTRGPFFNPSISHTDIDLPRNIIEDLNIRSWTEALAHYHAMCPCIDHPESLESVFCFNVTQIDAQEG